MHEIRVNPLNPGQKIPVNPLNPLNPGQASPMVPPKFIGNFGDSSVRLIGPNEASYFSIFSFKANNSLLACSGVITILDFTLALGAPGISRIKSITNSLFECAIIARLE